MQRRRRAIHAAHHRRRNSTAILRSLAERRTGREIAESLFLIRRTVEWYVSDILARL